MIYKGERVGVNAAFCALALEWGRIEISKKNGGMPDPPCVLVVSSDLAVIAGRVLGTVVRFTEDGEERFSWRYPNVSLVVDPAAKPCEWGLYLVAATIDTAKEQGIYTEGC